MSFGTDLSRGTVLRTTSAVFVVGVEVDTDTTAFVEALLTRQLALTGNTDFTGPAGVATGPTRGHIRLNINTEAAAFGQACLTRELTSFVTDFSGVTGFGALSTVEAVVVGVDAGSIAIGQARLARELAAALAANLARGADLSTATAVLVVGTDVNTLVGAIG